MSRLEVTVLDHLGHPTPARLNVIGADHGYYEPRAEENPLSAFSLKRMGHRSDRGPARYHGSFFYSPGQSMLFVPPGPTRIEARKGYAHFPVVQTCQVRAGQVTRVEVRLVPVVDMQRHGWHGVDTHLHVARESRTDKRLLHALAAEGVHFGHSLSMNPSRVYSSNPAEQTEARQHAGYGSRSVVRHSDHDHRRPQALASGHEYRTRHLGHVTQLMIEDLVPARGRITDTSKGPALATIYEQTVEAGGVMGHAHGGYELELLSDLVLNKSDWVELLQFGHYRGIGLRGYYTALNSGFRYPLGGACDYPFCRTLADCMVYARGPEDADIVGLTGSLLRGESFATSGPLLFLSVGEQTGPGGQIHLYGKPSKLSVKVQVVSADLPVSEIEVIQAGEVVARLNPPQPSLRHQGQVEIHVDGNTWIAARCHGARDARAHTNPVWVTLDGRLPFDPQAAARLRASVDAFRPSGIDARTGAVLERARQEAASLTGRRRGPESRIPTYPRGATRAPEAPTRHWLPPIAEPPRPSPAVTVTGLVQDADGAPLAGAEVSARGGDPKTTTAADGRFSLPGVGPDAPVFLRVRKTGWMTTNTSYLNPDSPVHVTCSRQQGLLTRFAAWAQTEPAVHSQHATTRPIVELRAPCPKLRRALSGSTASPNSTVLGLPPGGAVWLGSTHVQFKDSPDADNTKEPNLIVTVPGLGRDLVGPVFQGQVTSLSTGPCHCAKSR